jgi:hypothetical protein
MKQDKRKRKEERKRERKRKKRREGEKKKERAKEDEERRQDETNNGGSDVLKSLSTEVPVVAKLEEKYLPYGVCA